MTLADVGPFIQQIGFPIFVAVWLLMRTDKFIRENTTATKDLATFLKTHLTK